MSALEHPAVLCAADVRISSDSYKRAVYRPPPSKFTVEMIPPMKQGGSYSYGIRICPVIRGDRSSISSRGSNREYEIWRRWEDCLLFQGTLELEYDRMARSKRQRLLRGKGVKKNGFYMQDQASSWESLPPGPDPKSVAQDIHAYIPAISRKGTVFRASVATVEKRAAELKAFVEALFQEDVPALIEELRRDRIVTDFFGYWRRDYDLAQKKRTSNAKPRTSITSSIFSTYFSASNLSVNDSSSSPERDSSPRASVTSQSTARGSNLSYRQLARYTAAKSYSDSSGDSPPASRPRALSATSSELSSEVSDPSFDSPVQTSVAIAEEVPVAFDYNPRRSSANGYEYPNSVLETLPEDVSKQDEGSFVPTRRRAASRYGMIILNPRETIYLSDSTDNEPGTPSPQSSTSRSPHGVRESWQTMDSASCILDGLNVTLPEEDLRRASRNSVATFMTNCSADAIVGPSPSFASPRCKKSPRVSAPVSVSEHDDFFGSTEYIDPSIVDSFPLPCFEIPEIIQEERPETALGYYFNNSHPATVQSVPSSPVPPSPTTSVAFSMSTQSSGTLNMTRLSIKAAYGSSIVMLRVSPEMPYKEVRQRIYGKFVGQEGVPLSESFSVGIAVPSSNARPDRAGRARSNSLGSGRVLDQQTHTKIIRSQADWEGVVASAYADGLKVALHIFDVALS